VVSYNPLLPLTGRATSKSGLTTTMITGSSANGEALPSHFQFQTSAQLDETQHAQMEMAAYLPGVKCKFGMTEMKVMAISVGFNEKGGMDDTKFEKYVKNSIMPLFPDALDIPGKRVLLKVDSRPGQCNVALLAKLCVQGWYLYPGVPNTMSIQGTVL
jgi:hypothetical protein